MDNYLLSPKCGISALGDDRVNPVQQGSLCESDPRRLLSLAVSSARPQASLDCCDCKETQRPICFLLSPLAGLFICGLLAVSNFVLSSSD